MKRVVLVYGESRSGKTYLAENLNSGYGWQMLSVDELYVAFVKTKCPEFYFGRLRTYVAPHYVYILVANGHTKEKYRRDYVAEWNQFLLDAIIGEIAGHDTLVVEGWLLQHSLKPLKLRLSQSAQVALVEVLDRTYWIDHAQVAIQDIAFIS
jgi:hypothetical protein